MLSQQQGHPTLIITTSLLPICWVYQILEIHTRSSNNGICPAKCLCFVKRIHSEQYFTTVFNLVTGRAHKLGIRLSCSSLSHRAIIRNAPLVPPENATIGQFMWRTCHSRESTLAEQEHELTFLSEALTQSKENDNTGDMAHSAATVTWRKDRGFVWPKPVGGAGWTRKGGEGRNAT